MNGLQMKYFVLKPGGDDIFAAASRKAMRAYSRHIGDVNEIFADELMDWANDEAEKADVFDIDPLADPND